MEDRLIEVETRLAFQEKAVEELNEVIIRQQAEIDRLEEELALLTTRLRALLAGPDALPKG